MAQDRSRVRKQNQTETDGETEWTSSYFISRLMFDKLDARHVIQNFNS